MFITLFPHDDQDVVQTVWRYPDRNGLRGFCHPLHQAVPLHKSDAAMEVEGIANGHKVINLTIRMIVPYKVLNLPFVQ